MIALSALWMGLMPLQAQDYCSKGYRGHVDAGYSVGVGDYDFGRFELSTSHGYQFNPYVFLGAGMGVHFMSSYATDAAPITLDTRDSQVDVPLFANLRIHLLNRRFTPLIDAKCGYFVTHNGGLYASAAVGGRYALSDRYALNLTVGYTREKLEFETFDRFIGSTSMRYYTSPRKLDTECISIKLGFEF